MSGDDSIASNISGDIGRAKIVYEDPDNETVETKVDNEKIAYFQDHWIIETGESDEGYDTVRRIPSQRVYYVERDVEEFKEEVKSLRDQVEMFAREVKSKIPSGSGGDRDSQRRGSDDPSRR